MFRCLVSVFSLFVFIFNCKFIFILKCFWEGFRGYSNETLGLIRLYVHCNIHHSNSGFIHNFERVFCFNSLFLKYRLITVPVFTLPFHLSILLTHHWTQCSVSIPLRNIWFSDVYRCYKNETLEVFWHVQAEWNSGLKRVKREMSLIVMQSFQNAGFRVNRFMKFLFTIFHKVI